MVRKFNCLIFEVNISMLRRYYLQKMNTELCEAFCACDMVENITRYKGRSKDHLQSIAL